MSKRTSLQVFFWLIIAGINVGFTIYFMPLKTVVMTNLFVLFFQMFVFYINSLIIFPRYFSLSNSGRFIVVTALFVLLVTFTQTFIDYFYFSKIYLKPFPFSKPHLLMVFMRILFWLLFIDMISTLFMMQDRIRKQAEQTQQIRAEKLQTELKLLKAQINPHFIFNTLNNIYSLTYMKSDKAPESVLKLSQMLRYVIEECVNEKVSLKSEIEYIENYITFQQMKSPQEQKIFFDYSQANHDQMIPPMLFIPFIENSFKYSQIDEYPEATIDIKISSTQHDVDFVIANSMFSGGNHKPGAGTGIENVRKRLEIIFPQKYTLQLDDKENKFIVHLKIVLDENKMRNN